MSTAPALKKLTPTPVELESGAKLGVNGYHHGDGSRVAQLSVFASAVSVMVSGVYPAEFDAFATQVEEARAFLNPDQEPTGAELIAAERRRQLDEEGWSAAHDDEHTNVELNFAAQAYCQDAIEPGTWPAVGSPGGHVAPPTWPWEAGWWKPSDDPVRNLVKAGALIAAEIDRLNRAAGAS